MAITIDCTTDRVISLEEYVDHVSHHVDVYDLEALRESAPWLKALGNNRRFLTERLNRELSDWRSFQPSNAYTAQTFMLGKGEGFFVRANIWVPPSSDPGIREFEAPVARRPTSDYAYKRRNDFPLCVAIQSRCWTTSKATTTKRVVRGDRLRRSLSTAPKRRSRASTRRCKRSREPALAGGCSLMSFLRSTAG